MSGHLPRYKVNPSLVDTAGFFDYYVPYTNQSVKPANDSIARYYDFSIYDFHKPKPVETFIKPGPSIFTSHQLQATSGGPKLRKLESTDWITGVVILCLLFLAWIQTNHSKRLRQIFRSVALPYYVNQLEREGNLYNERITLGLGFINLTSVSFLIYLFIQWISGVPSFLQNYQLYLIIISSLTAYIFLKAFIIQTTGVIFKTPELTHAYRLNALIFNHTTGLFIFPVLLLALYWQPLPFLWIAAGIYIILLIYRFMRGITIGLSNTKFSVFYLILYLCTLEILPVILIVNFVRQI
ncbi:MAG: DUF4271 domain-containing protein [Bacteroidales bacterium]|nr:DUF4271 domain-containing protein [Bacteroidales bacterium]